MRSISSPRVVGRRKAPIHYEGIAWAISSPFY